MSDDCLLVVEGASLAFPGVQALEDMHLNLRHGELLALVGESRLKYGLGPVGFKCQIGHGTILIPWQ